MTRLEQALKWWEENTEPGWHIPHENIPLHYVKALRKAGLIKYEYKLFWYKGIPGDDKNLGDLPKDFQMAEYTK